MKKIVTYMRGYLARCIMVCLMIQLMGMNTQAASVGQFDFNNLQQEIDGFGVSQPADVYGKQLYDFGARSEVMDLLFSSAGGAGLSMLRQEVGCGAGDMKTIQPSQGNWDKSINPSTNWVLQEAKSRGVETFFATVWSPPAWMKTNNSLYRGGSLKSEHYTDFAVYLAEYDKMLEDQYGINFDAISIANEPEYSAPWQSCRWDGNSFRVFIRDHLKPTWESYSRDTMISIGEDGTWREDKAIAALNDPEACERIDIVSGHHYHGSVVPFDTARAKGKKVWETEVSNTILGFDTGINDAVNWAEDIHQFMVDAKANAYNYWLGAAYKNNDEALIQLREDGSYGVSKRLYAMGQFSRFVRPGFVRVGGIDSPKSGISLSAYRDLETDRIVIVAINNNGSHEVVNMTLNNTEVNTLQHYVTNQEHNIQQFSDVPIINKQVRLSLGAKSIVTLVGDVSTPSIPQKDWTVVDTLNNWHILYDTTPSWGLDDYNPYGGFDEDYSRALRRSTTNEHLIYRFDNITDFEADIYFHDSLSGLAIYGSADGLQWNQLPVQHTLPLLTGEKWHKTLYYLDEPLTTPINYIKIEFTGGNVEWDKQLGELRVASSQQEEAYDTLDNFSKVIDKSNNWMIDSSKPYSFEGDQARARRTTKTTEYLIYDVEGFSEFDAKLYYFRDHNWGINFYGSDDMQQWYPIEVEQTQGIWCGNHWYRCYAHPINDLSDTIKYLKVEFSGGGLWEWDKQLSDINFMQ